MKCLRPSFIIWPLFFILPLQNVLAQRYGRGLIFDDPAYVRIPRKAELMRSLDTLPPRASIKEFAPIPKSQGDYNTCTEWACAYCARTMVDAIRSGCKNKDSITAMAYSPAFLFRVTNPDDYLCSAGNVLDLALSVMKAKGGIPYADLPSPCVPNIGQDQMKKAPGGKLRDFVRLFDVNSDEKFKIQTVKKSISERKPVVFGMLCPPSFEHAYRCWRPTEEPLPAYEGHAMCVVSYDDTLYNGAFEVQNSWGLNWGFHGYTWITYKDFARFARYAFEMIDLPDSRPNIADLSGSIKLKLRTGAEMPANLLVSTRGLKAAAAQQTDGPMPVYQTANAYTSGTEFRIYISNNQPAYVYAISSDLSNADNVLFPSGNVSAALTYKKNVFTIPAEDSLIAFDDRPGKDFLCVLYSRAELKINDIIAKIHGEQGTFNERIFKVVGSRMVDPANVRFDNQQIAFQGVSGGKDIIALMVEMDHK